jgi:hypothetical protein
VQLKELGGRSLASRTTNSQGLADFRLPLTSSQDLMLYVDPCPACTFIDSGASRSAANAGLGPARQGINEYRLPRCESPPCDYGGLRFLLVDRTAPVTITSVSPTVGGDGIEGPVSLSDATYYPAPPLRVNGQGLHPGLRFFVIGHCESFSSSCHQREMRLIRVAPDGTSAEIEVPTLDGFRLRTGSTFSIEARNGDQRIRLQRGFRLAGSATDPAYLFTFGFRNRAPYASDPSGSWDEFDGVFGNNAYICLGVCPCRVRDPIYVLFKPVYSAAVDMTVGACSGFASLTQRARTGSFAISRVAPGVIYPAGAAGLELTPLPDALEGPFDPPWPDRWQYAEEQCRPSQPGNLWSHIRAGQGVIFSAEFISGAVARRERPGIHPRQSSSTA